MMPKNEQKVKVIERSDYKSFEKDCGELLEKGYLIKSSNCNSIDDGDYGVIKNIPSNTNT